MIVIKNKAALTKMKKAGQLLAQVLVDVQPLIKPGVSTFEIDTFIEKSMRAKGLVPECIGYGGYRHASCISVNDVIVHGVPSEQVILADGDFVKVDVVGSYKKYCADMARSFFVGTPNKMALKMAQVAQDALDSAIKMIKPGVYLSQVSAEIQRVVEEAGFGVVRHFVGHGIGRNMHEAPEIPNFKTKDRGPVLREGMTLAIEPMITEKDYTVKIMPDGWTACTQDGGLAAHVEDTIAVSSSGAEVLTRLDG